MTTEASQNPPEKTKEQLWAELDQAEGMTPAVPAQAVTKATDAELEQAAAQATPAATTATEQGAADEAAPQEGAGTATQATPAADPFANMAPEVKDRILGLETLVTQLGTRLRNAEGHIGGINHQLKAAQRTTASGHEAPTAAQIAAAQGSDSALAKLKADYPEFGAALEKVLDERIGAPRAAAPAAQAAPAQQPGEQPSAREILNRVDARGDELYRQLTVEVAHPGWQKHVKTPAFIGWLQQQPREVQMLGASDEPQDAIRLIDLHKASAQTAVTRQQRLDSAAALPQGRAAAGAKPKPIESMSKAEYWAYLDNLEAQQQRS